MKPITAATFLTAVLFLLTPAVAQTPAQKDADELNALIKDVQAQQAEIAENQAKIDEKLATLGETIREARIFSSRGGR
jgi:ABC-type transporter MlaC component